MRSSITKLLVVAAILVIAAAPAFAQVTEYFGGAGFQWYHYSDYGGGASPYLIWRAGDYWAQEFSVPCFPCVGAIALGLDLDATQCGLSEPMQMNVLLNGSSVGGFSIMPGMNGVFNYSFSGFAPVSGPLYEVKLLEVNDITPWAGSANIRPTTSFVTFRGGECAIPEAGSLGLALMGFASVGGALLRRRK